MTSNPMTQENLIHGVQADANPMTIAGTVNKTIGLLTLVVAVSAFTWYLIANGYGDKATMLAWLGIIGGLICIIAMRFRPQNSKILSIGYAVCEGLALGTISAIYEAAFPGIVMNAAVATFITLFTMLFLYKARIIQATKKFRAVVMTATAAIMVFYLINIALSHFMPSFNPVWRSGPIGIGISAAICVIAALNFILDFDFIEKGAAQMIPKYYEWFGATSLLVTIIWLYLEILRLLSKIRSR